MRVLVSALAAPALAGRWDQCGLFGDKNCGNDSACCSVYGWCGKQNAYCGRDDCYDYCPESTVLSAKKAGKWSKCFLTCYAEGGKRWARPGCVEAYEVTDSRTGYSRLVTNCDINKEELLNWADSFDAVCGAGHAQQRVDWNDVIGWTHVTGFESEAVCNQVGDAVPTKEVGGEETDEDGCGCTSIVQTMLYAAKDEIYSAPDGLCDFAIGFLADKLVDTGCGKKIQKLLDIGDGKDDEDDDDWLTPGRVCELIVSTAVDKLVVGPIMMPLCQSALETIARESGLDMAGIFEEAKAHWEDHESRIINSAADKVCSALMCESAGSICWNAANAVCEVAGLVSSCESPAPSSALLGAAVALAPGAATCSL